MVKNVRLKIAVRPLRPTDRPRLVCYQSCCASQSAADDMLIAELWRHASPLPKHSQHTSLGGLE